MRTARCHLILVALVCGVGGMSLPSALADGGVILASRDVGGMQATILGSPSPLRAGPADISILLQEDGVPVLDAEVTMRWTSLGAGQEWLPPCCSMKTEGAGLVAKRGHGRNQLLYSAILPLTSSGPGKLDLAITRGGEPLLLVLDLEVVPAPAPVLAYWPWLAMTPVAILLFSLHQHITASRRRLEGLL